MAGPRTPTNVLELRGAFEKNPQRKRKAEPQPEKPLGNPPKHMTPEQKATWKEIEKNAPPGVFGNSDRIAVEVVAVLLTEFRTNPAEFSAARMARMDSLLGRFGMTPADRSKVVVKDGDKEQDPWDDL